jgi:hypothetical protein
MKFKKLYLDAVADDGAGVVGYAADATIGGLTFHPASLLAWNGDRAQAASHQWALRSGARAEPESATGWRCPGLDVSFAWRLGRGHAPWREQILWDANDVRVSWRVIAPRAWVEMRDVSGRPRLAGRGYAEVLAVEGPPWRLPISTLRWGRFVSATRNVTWIEWANRDGGLRWLWHDSDAPETQGVSMDGEAVVWRGHRLELHRWRTLRSGRIGKTVFGKAGVLSRALPSWVLALDETKWLARGRLSGPGGLADTGWVIHEEVIFRSRVDKTEGTQ